MAQTYEAPDSALALRLVELATRLTGCPPALLQKAQTVARLADENGWGEATKSAMILNQLDRATVHGHLAPSGWTAARVRKARASELLRALADMPPVANADDGTRGRAA